MKKLLAFALMALVPVGCTSLPTEVSPGVSIQADEVQLKGTQALIVATDAYTGAATIVEAGVRQGAFNDDQLRRIDTLNDQALALIQGTNTALSVAQRAAALASIVTQLHSIIGR